MVIVLVIAGLRLKSPPPFTGEGQGGGCINNVECCSSPPPNLPPQAGGRDFG